MARIDDNSDRSSSRRWSGIGAALFLVAMLVVPALSEDFWRFSDDVSLLDLSGQRASLRSALGDSVLPSDVVVLYWSMFQPESRRALRAVDRLAKGMNSQGVIVSFVAIESPEYREPPESVAEFLSRAQVELRAFIDPEGRAIGAIARALEIEQPVTPTCIHIGTGGRLVRLYVGWEESYSVELRRDLTGKHR